MSGAPLVSVVIPTHERASRLSFALEALAAQTLEAHRFEVIVAAPSGSARPIEAPTGPEIRLVEGPDASPAALRNLGWRDAAAPIVAFTGDDCRPAPAWLERLLAAVGGAAPDHFASGPVEPDPDERHLLYGIARTAHASRPDGWFGAANIAYPRRLLEQLGGFDESLAGRSADADLGLRALAAGAEAGFCAEAVVRHAVRVRSFREALREAASAAGEPALLARHPQQRERLHLRTFVSEDHASLLLALAGALLWRRSRPLALLAAYPYVKGRVAKRLHNPNPLSPLGAFRIAADVVVEGSLDSVEMAAQARSSVASRELVL